MFRLCAHIAAKMSYFNGRKNQQIKYESMRACARTYGVTVHISEILYLLFHTLECLHALFLAVYSI